MLTARMHTVAASAALSFDFMSRSPLSKTNHRSRKPPSELSQCQRQRACQFLDNPNVYSTFTPDLTIDPSAAFIDHQTTAGATAESCEFQIAHFQSGRELVGASGPAHQDAKHGYHKQERDYHKDIYRQVHICPSFCRCPPGRPLSWRRTGASTQNRSRSMLWVTCPRIIPSALT
jgi:hypothetical protein